MTIPHYRVNLSIASPAEIEHTAQQLAVVREDYLSAEGSFSAEGNVASWTPRLLIFNSWQRCRTFQVNPAQRYAPLAIARETQLYQLHDENELLIRAAHAVMNHLVDVLADSGYVVVLSDTQGRLLEIMGDTAIRRRLARIDFVAGGDWSEAAAGTNAIGTALADKHVVQLMGAEHYCDGWQDLTCTAAPIRHPFTDEIVGVLDVTGNYRLIRPFLTSFLATAALEIEQQLQMLLLEHNYSALRQTHLASYALHPTLHTPFNALTSEKNMSSFYQRKPTSSITANTPLHSSVQEQRVHDAERLTAAYSIVSASLDLQLTLEKVVTQTAYLLKVESVGVHIFNEKGELDSVYFARPLPLEKTPDCFIAQLEQTNIITLIRERGEPVLIENVLTSNLFQDACLLETGIRALTLLPLVSPRGVNGFISVCKPVAHAWHIEEIRLGISFAAQSAIAIENARLFEVLQQHNRHMEVLNAIAQTINTLPNPGQHFDLLLQRISEMMHIRGGVFLLQNPYEQQLTLASQYGIPEGLPYAPDSVPWSTLHSLACKVIASEKPLLIDGDKTTCKEAPSLKCFYNLLAVPLTASGTVLGALLVGHDANKTFVDDDLKLFTTIGQQLGLTIKNTQLLRSANEMEILREADHLKSGFLAAVSHDLRSPLTAIHASVESLLDNEGVQSVVGKNRLLQNIAGQTHRMGQLVDQLLDLSRIEAGVLPLDRDWTDIPALIEDTVKDFERLHNGCTIQYSFETKLPLYYIDPDRLIQVVWNLLENAFKYTTYAAPIHVQACLLEQEIHISVRDHGPGIPKGEHEKIFQRFYRLAKDQQAHTPGSGLGLAICRGIIEAHSGHIWVEDAHEGGSTFIIALPLSMADPDAYDPMEVE